MQKRTAIKALGVLALYPIVGCSILEPEPPPKVIIEAEGIKTLGQLIEEMRRRAGKFAPQKINLDEVYRIVAEVFVDYARSAIEMGVSIPKEIAERLPLKNKVALPAMVVFALWGVTFIVPIKAFFDAALGSLAALTLFIMAVISSRTKPAGKEKV